MAANRFEVEIPDELAAQLEEVASALGIRDSSEAAVIAIAEWVGRRKSELDDRDASQRYFINEALDALAESPGSEKGRTP